MPGLASTPRPSGALPASGLKPEAIAPVGRSKETLQSWRAGHTTPSSAALAKLCEVLHCNPQDLILPVDRLAEVAERHAVRSPGARACLTRSPTRAPSTTAPSCSSPERHRHGARRNGRHRTSTDVNCPPHGTCGRSTTSLGRAAGAGAGPRREPPALRPLNHLRDRRARARRRLYVEASLLRRDIDGSWYHHVWHPLDAHAPARRGSSGPPWRGPGRAGGPAGPCWLTSGYCGERRRRLAEILGPAAYLGPAGDYAIDCASETEADPVAVLTRSWPCAPP